MTTYIVVCALILTTRLIATSSTQDTDHFQLSHTEPRPVGRAYSLIGCNYRFQAGYTCLSCHRALHCYPGNAAILVDCYGLFRYCRDGRCSVREGDKCPDNGDMSALMIANNTIAAASPVVAAQAAAAELEAAQAAEAAQAVEAAAVVAQTAEVVPIATAAVIEAATEVSRDTKVTEALEGAEVVQIIDAASATTEVLQAAEFAQATEVSRPPFDLRVAKRPEASTTKQNEMINEVV